MMTMALAWLVALLIVPHGSPLAKPTMIAAVLHLSGDGDADEQLRTVPLASNAFVLLQLIANGCDGRCEAAIHAFDAAAADLLHYKLPVLFARSAVQPAAAEVPPGGAGRASGNLSSPLLALREGEAQALFLRGSTADARWNEYTGALSVSDSSHTVGCCVRSFHA